MSSAAALQLKAQMTGPQLLLGNPNCQSVYDAALTGLQANTRTMRGFARPVLLEGANYSGVWLECAPLEGLVYAPYSPAVALANHEVFFDLQREDGYIPYSLRDGKIGTSQIQMVVPIAATAWGLYRRNRNAAFLDKSYRACTRWNEWLASYRDTRRTGLCEAFCEYDTGHDNSPRFRGKPRSCPDGDARVCPRVDGLPYLAPDLSATVYGGRVALASMARELGRRDEEARWLEKAEAIRKTIMERLYAPAESAFFDVDSHSQFVRIRGDLISRVLGEHVPDRDTFEAVYRNQMRNGKAFWTLYPFPSIAANDPAFERPTVHNTWSGASQALTALRAPRWMEHYGQYADLTYLMQRWVKAVAREGAFRQQMDPFTGSFTPDQGSYSPAMLVLIDFLWRLHGVRSLEDTLEWNCRLPAGSDLCSATVSTTAGNAHVQTTASGSTLSIGGNPPVHITGPVRLVTKLDGTPLRLVGTEQATVTVKLRRKGQSTIRRVQQDEVVDLTAPSHHL